MSEAFYIPQKFHLYLKRFQAYRKNKIRLQPLSKSSFNSGGEVITFELSGLIDPSTFCVHMNAKSQNGTADGTSALPPNVESLFNRHTIYAGGNVVNNSFQNSNLLFNALYGLKCGQDVNDTSRSIVHNSQPNALANNTTSATKKLILNQICGLMSVGHYLDCTMLGGIRVDLITEVGNVCASSNGGTPNFTLNDVYATVDVIELQDEAKLIYDQAILAKMKNGGISFGYKNYMSFVESVNTMSGSMKLSIASSSLNKLIVVPRDSAYATVGNHELNNTTAKVSKYLASRKGNLDQYYFQIAGRQTPSFNVDATSGAFLFSQEALGLQNDISTGSLITSPTVYTGHRYLIVHSCEYVGDANLDRAVMGLDTRGSPNIYFNMLPSGDATANEINVFAECTSVLRVLAQGVVQVES